MFQSKDYLDLGLSYFQWLGGALIPWFLKPRDKALKGAKRNPFEKMYFSRNCDKGTIEPAEGRVQGEIPSWLEGTLIRNGPGIIKVGEDEYNHVFDGLAVLHRFQIQNGKVTYTSRPLESDAYEQNMSANRIVVSEFGTVSFRDPCKTLFQRLQATFDLVRGHRKGEFTDNCNINIAYFGDQLYAMTETNFIRRIDPKDLKSIGQKTNLKDYVVVNHATAHPHILPDGSAINLGNNYQHRRGPRCIAIKIPPTFGKEETALTGAKVVAEIPLSSSLHFPYYHSFGMTLEHVIFIEAPLRTDLLKFLTSRLRTAPLATALRWHPDLQTRFKVASFITGENLPIVYEADPIFTFHHINAFEKDGHIVVDVVAYNDGKMFEYLKDETSEHWEIKCNPRRYVLPLNAQGAVPGQNLVTLADTTARATVIQAESKTNPATVHLEPEHLSTATMELPRINYKYNGRPYNFFYGVGADPENRLSVLDPDRILKTDIKNKIDLQWQEKGKVPSEPVFVANPNGEDEDDGVILSSLIHPHELHATTLLILDAKNLEEIARVCFETEGVFTSTFHGCWDGEQRMCHA